jgi:hypothetical protein
MLENDTPRRPYAHGRRSFVLLVRRIFLEYGLNFVGPYEEHRRIGLQFELHTSQIDSFLRWQLPYSREEEAHRANCE